MTKRKGFVVFDAFTIGALGLSAVLSLVMAPAITRARSNANQVACRAHLRGFSMAFPLYAADNSQVYPYLGSDLEVNKLNDAPVATDSRAKLFSANQDCNLQTYWLLVNQGSVADGQFECPADDDYAEPKRRKDYGFDAWLNSSYATQPTTSKWKARLSQSLDGSVVLMADRPRRGQLDGPSANHAGGLNFLNNNGSVQWVASGKEAGADSDHIYTIGQKDFHDSYLIWGKANLPLEKEREHGK
jgi:hypothetical protein